MKSIADLVYDVGMNNGDDTGYYLHTGHRVVAIEANPQLVAEVSIRFHQAISDGRLCILNIGISRDTTDAPFWICDDQSEWSSFDRASAARNGCRHHPIAVKCMEFRSVLEQYGVPRYLKVDIEGADRLCLEDLRPEIAPSYLSLEATDIGLLDLLREKGYTRFQCISQFRFLPIQRTPSWAERRYGWAQRLAKRESVAARLWHECGGWRWTNRQLERPHRNGWTFPFGSSGPFGEDLPGRWYSYDEMRSVYQTFLDRRDAGATSHFWYDKGYSFWADFHARLPALR